MEACILCNSRAVINIQESAARTIYNCPLCGTFVVSDMAAEEIKASSARIASFMMERETHGHNDIVFITNDHIKDEKGYLQISVSGITARYPQTFGHRMDAALANLANRSEYPGASISIDRIELCPMLYVEEQKEQALAFMLHAMQEQKLISIQSRHGSVLPCTVTVTAKGWKSIEEAQSEKQKSDGRALVLSLGDDYCKAVRKACRASGYHMLSVEAADISPMLMAQVKAAKVIICEVSQLSPAAYYAIGMARALGKLDILTCSAEKRGEIPFSGEQMAILKWETHEELSNILAYTIQSFTG
ncbi:MAG: hypothetical protein FWH00_03655 [Oscillospiraceae bacterium]|nr:hypothetical protein [Oscillospiraceae bacterium]